MYAIFSSPVLLVFHVYIQRVAYKYQPFCVENKRVCTEICKYVTLLLQLEDAGCAGYYHDVKLRNE